MPQRQQALHKWLKQHLTDDFQMHAMVGDASFRRYFRITTAAQTFVAMDAPPAVENCIPFVTIALLLQRQGLTVPKIIAADIEQGFLLLSDLGQELYFHVLNASNADTLYLKALEDLVLIHQCPTQSTEHALPAFDHAFMWSELQNFQHWFLEQYLNLMLKPSEKQLLSEVFHALTHSAATQPQVCVHRDYHSRNLLWQSATRQVGILDFQDAVLGPITYDAVSLLRDCYISWPASNVTSWLKTFYQLLSDANLLTSVSFEQFTRWFDWMGVQRHMKAIFIYARKYLRDNSKHYLNDIPRGLNYILAQTSHYPEFHTLHQWLEERVMPCNLVAA